MTTVDAKLGELARAMPGITPPDAPVAAERVKAAVKAITDALGRAREGRPQR